MKASRFFFSALIAVCASSISASAQVADNKQTPENAQKFLATVLVGAPFVDGREDIWLPGPLGGDYYTADGRRWNDFSASEINSALAKARTFRLLSWTSLANVCRSELVIDGQAVVLTGPSIKSMYGSWYSHTTTFRQNGNRTIAIDWSKITSATVGGNAVALTTTQPIGSGYESLKGANQIRLILADEGMAARAGFAAEVIRLKCDTTKDLGF